MYESVFTNEIRKVVYYFYFYYSIKRVQKMNNFGIQVRIWSTGMGSGNFVNFIGLKMNLEITE